MRRNEARRQQLLDAAIAVLAQEGGRGLSYRTLDAAAELPTGTASNYFRDRNELLRQVAERIHIRLQPDSSWVSQTLQQHRGSDLLHTLLLGMVQRVMAQPLTFRALLELRLEALRLPELNEVLGHILRLNFLENQKFTGEAGFPLGQDEFALLYVAMNGLLIELVTAPDTLNSSPSCVVETLVSRLKFPPL